MSLERAGVDADLKENLESCCRAVWLAESRRSSAEMFCRASSLEESWTASSPQISVSSTMRLAAPTVGIFRRAVSFLTSCPVVRRSTSGAVARAAPLDVPVLVQDVFCCLYLAALSGQRLIWTQAEGRKKKCGYTSSEYSCTRKET